MRINCIKEMLIIYTLLFTIKGSNPDENKYVDMLSIWLAYVNRNSGLQKVIIIMDTVTLDSIFLQELGRLYPNLVIEVQSMPQPQNISEGMACRFTLQNNDNNTYMYMDLDMLILKDLADFTNDLPSSPNNLIIFPEGKMIHPMYSEDLIDKSRIPEGFCGFTSGFFIFTPGEEVYRMFNNIIVGIINNKKPYYTYDQPFFNAEVFNKIHSSVPNVNIKILSSEICANNSFNIKDELFINFCGDPAEGNIHFNKLLMFMCYDFANKNIST